MTYKLNREQGNKIIITNVMLVFCLLFLPFLASSQIKKIVGTYTYSNEEYLQIDVNNFKIIRTEEGIRGDMDEGDSVIAFGRVEYINNDFIKLTSYKYDLDIYNSTIFTELHDKNLSDDSIQIRFNFPLKGEFKIYISFSSGYNYVSVNSKNITIPKSSYYLTPLHFDIYKTDILVYDFSSNYLGSIVFSYFPSYEFKNMNLNLLNVTIPNLTNSYYARYYIDDEYAKIEGNKIIWRNREYEKYLIV